MDRSSPGHQSNVVRKRPPSAVDVFLMKTRKVFPEGWNTMSGQLETA
jgi:hypothetical protein